MKMFRGGEKEDWLWTLMVWIPGFIDDEEIKSQVEILRTKKPNPALDKVR